MLSKKEDLIERIRTLPKKRLTDIDKQLIFILVERSKIQRERSVTILNKGFLVFFAFIIIAILSRLYEIVDQLFINILFVFGIAVITIAMLAYQTAIKKEEQTLDGIFDYFLK